MTRRIDNTLSRGRLLSTCGLLGLAGMLLSACGCQSYGPVSDAAYDYSMALYSLTNRQAETKLDDFGEQIEAAQEAGEISPKEAEWLLQIIDEARDGNWKEANQASRTMMQEQVQ